MSRNQPSPGARLAGKTSQGSGVRHRNVCDDRDEIILLSDAFDMNPNADWNSIFHRVTRGQPIRGVSV